VLTKQFQKFVQLEAAGGIILILVLMCALVIANTPIMPWYEKLIDLPIQIRIGQLDIHKPLFLWINDGLMALFFMLLALEFKRELLEGELSSLKRMTLPFIAAIGGIVVPALVYLVFNFYSGEKAIGWPITVATDVAFALGIVAILGPRVPPSLKAFLVGLSIVDDILAITIIAAFYTDKLSYLSLILAGVGVIVLIAMNLTGQRKIGPYLFIGTLIWICVLKSGVHATLAGVAVGLCVPLRGKEGEESPAQNLEHSLHKWVAFLVLPLFVFANGGIPFVGTPLTDLFGTVPIGIILGLLVGKAIGVFFFSAFVIKLGLSELPVASSWRQLFALSVLTGIGFTMSLFLASLSFYNTEFEIVARQAVLIGSLVACVISVALFLSVKNPANEMSANEIQEQEDNKVIE